MIDIHATAVIHPSAKLGEGVQVGPYAVIGAHSQVGDGTSIGSHAVIEPFTSIGRDCQIFPHAVIGGVPQDLKYAGEESITLVGDRNVIREFVTVNRATGEGEVTRIGDDNLLMAYVHVAHNCIVGSGVVLANNVTLAGHVEIQDFATVGGLVGIHQFCRVGAMAMVGAMTRIVQDVPPYMTVEGSPAKAFGPNTIGLRRRGLSLETRNAIKQAYRLLYRSGLNLTQALAEMETLAHLPEIRHLMAFARATERGFVGRTAKSQATALSQAADQNPAADEEEA